MSSWKSTTIEAITEVVTKGTTPTSVGFKFTESGINFVKVETITPSGQFLPSKFGHIDEDCHQSLKRSQLASGDILFSIAGALGRTAQVTPEILPANTNQALAIIRLKPSPDVMPEFILLALSSGLMIEQIEKQRGGVAQQNLSLAQVKNFQIPLPPLSEQKRIVSIVDEAFEAIDIAIDNTKQNLTNARELFESYLNSRLFNVVSEKATQTLLCITDLIIDCEHKTAPIQEEGIPSIRTPNIGKGHLIFDGVYRVSEETYELWTRRGKPESGDLILAREAPAGNVGVVPPGAKVCLGQRTVLIRPNKKIIDSHYLAFLLLHPIMQKRLLDKSTGATVQHVNMKDIRGLSMSELPSIQVQKACVEELEHFKSEVNRLEKIYQGKLAALNELKQSILHKAFTGELTADKADLKTNIEPEASAV
jgi:type I restriction enzyme, S subunit